MAHLPKGLSAFPDARRSNTLTGESSWNWQLPETAQAPGNHLQILQDPERHQPVECDRIAMLICESGQMDFVKPGRSKLSKHVDRPANNTDTDGPDNLESTTNTPSSA
jgi:hypothetical protein